MSTQVDVGVLYVQCCIECGVRFGVPTSFDEQRRDDHRTFYCPNKHPQHYAGLNREEKLERDLERAKRRAASAEGQATRAEYRRRAAKGQLTKTKNRIANGVCPCCNRTFKDLAAHMQTKHPEYAE